jgi:hypothetical protein
MAVAAILAGCLGADDEPRPGGDAAREIAEVVDRLEQATAEHAFGLICRDLFTAAPRDRAGGPDCARLTRSAPPASSGPAARWT